MKAVRSSSLSHLVAATLRSSWSDATQLNLDLSETELDAVTPLLYDSGAAALGWWRVRDTEFRDTPSGELLHQAFRLLALRARTHKTRIEKLFRLFRDGQAELTQGE